MREFMYDVNAVVIVLALFISILLAIEIGFRIGVRRRQSATKASRVHINAIQTSILGIIALLLAFTFSLSIQRFDRRSDAVVDEANAIRASYLRAELIPVPLRDEVDAILRDYLQLRIEEGELPLSDHSGRNALLAKMKQSQSALWSYARRAADLNPTSESTLFFLQAVSDINDTFVKREAALDRHVPEVVLMLMYVTFLMTGAIIGFTSGVSAHRPSFGSYIMVTFMVLLVFVILDLDRPRRGLIIINHQSFIDLRETMQRNHE